MSKTLQMSIEIASKRGYALVVAKKAGAFFSSYIVEVANTDERIAEFAALYRKAGWESFDVYRPGSMVAETI